MITSWISCVLIQTIFTECLLCAKSCSSHCLKYFFITFGLPGAGKPEKNWLASQLVLGVVGSVTSLEIPCKAACSTCANKKGQLGSSSPGWGEGVRWIGVPVTKPVRRERGRECVCVCVCPVSHCRFYYQWVDGYGFHFPPLNSLKGYFDYLN